VLPYDEDGALVTDRDDAIHHCLRSLGVRLAAAGVGLADVVRTTVYLTDLSWREALDAGYRRTFAAPLPARTAVEVRALPGGSGIEIDAVVQVVG
jgi:enamine deaminase RidA (YjgF/YER057c/UK114 family)